MKFKTAIASIAAFTLCAGAASAATESASASANAIIVTPAKITAIRSLEFGTIAKPTTSTNTITVPSALSATATPLVSGAGNAFIPTGGQARAAMFRLAGTASQTIAVNTSSLSFTNQTGNLSNVTPEAPVALVGSLTQLSNLGQADIYVGGRFDISPTTSAQAYTGTLTLSIDFN